MASALLVAIFHLLLASAIAVDDCTYLAVDKKTMKRFFYDLNPLRTAPETPYSAGPDTYKNTFYINFCGGTVLDSKKCGAQAVCMLAENGKYYGCGSPEEQAIRKLNTTTDPSKGVMIIYSGGAECSSGQFRVTAIFLDCDMSVSTADFTSALEPTGACGYQLYARSKYGCGVEQSQSSEEPWPPAFATSALSNELFGINTYELALETVANIKVPLWVTNNKRNVYVASKHTVIAVKRDEWTQTVLPFNFTKIADVSASEDMLAVATPSGLSTVELHSSDTSNLTTWRTDGTILRGSLVSEQRYAFVTGADQFIHVISFEGKLAFNVPVPEMCQTPQVLSGSSGSDLVALACSNGKAIVGVLDYLDKTAVDWNLPIGSGAVTGLEFINNELWVVSNELGLWHGQPHSQLEVAINGPEAILDICFAS